MTPKIIELKQTPVVLVELLEGAKEAHLDIRTGRICWSAPMKGARGGRMWHYLSSAYTGANAIGILSDLTEEQFAGIVDKVNFESGPVYKNYKTFKGLGKASEAFDTLLESEKVYTENPLEKTSKSIGHGTLDNIPHD